MCLEDKGHLYRGVQALGVPTVLKLKLYGAIVISVWLYNGKVWSTRETLNGLDNIILNTGRHIPSCQ